LKARSAILPAGHRANGAFWFDDKSGRFVTSDYFAVELPPWVQDFNSQKLADKFVERTWKGFDAWNFHAEANSARPYDQIPASPWGNELIERLAEKAIDAERLGQRDATDLLVLAYSANDYIGHRAGPDAPEVRDMAIRTDALLANLFDLVEKKVGLERTLVVLSADHGVAPLPEIQEQRKMPGGYVFLDVEDLVRSALNKKYGTEQWILGSVDNSIYLDHDVLAKKNVELGMACRTAVDAILAVPQAHAARVLTREELGHGVSGDFVTNALQNGFFPARSGDIIVVFEPYYMPPQKEPTRTNHFTPYNYDAHVPVLFLGAGIKPGRYSGNISVNDIAPTLATMLEVELPSGASGRVLTEMLR
jgi:arylsulfatase A-like enzyme